MKTRKEDTQACESQQLNNLSMYSDEELNLDELLHVEGGADDLKDIQDNCGLGCFTGGIANVNEQK